MMDRRASLGALGLLAAPLGAKAQPAGGILRIRCPAAGQPSPRRLWPPGSLRGTSPRAWLETGNQHPHRGEGLLGRPPRGARPGLREHGPGSSRGDPRPPRRPRGRTEPGRGLGVGGAAAAARHVQLPPSTHLSPTHKAEAVERIASRISRRYSRHRPRRVYSSLATAQNLWPPP